MENERKIVTALSMRDDDQVPELFVKCECAAEALEITYWDDDKQFFVSFWDIGRSKVSWVPWKQRLQMIWKILRGKDLYSDMVILDHKRAKQAADFINEILDKEDVQSNNN
jgi:hypothetical protein